MEILVSNDYLLRERPGDDADCELGGLEKTENIIRARKEKMYCHDCDVSVLDYNFPGMPKDWGFCVRPSPYSKTGVAKYYACPEHKEEPY